MFKPRLQEILFPEMLSGWHLVRGGVVNGLGADMKGGKPFRAVSLTLTLTLCHLPLRCDLCGR